MAAFVELLSLPPGDTAESVLPISYMLATVEEVGTGTADKKSVICCEVEVMEEQINSAKHLVAVNRTRCILKEVETGDRSFCWFFGEYSDSLVRLGVVEKDLVMICCPTVVRTKLKPKQVLPPNMSGWTIHCLEKDPAPRVIFVRKEEQQPSQEMEVTNTHQEKEISLEQDGVLLDQSRLVEDLSSSQEISKAKLPLQVLPQIRGGPVPPPAMLQPPTNRLSYTSLSSCTSHKTKYNVFAVLSQVVETTRRRKSKIVTKLTLEDESLYSCGELKDHFKIDICDTWSMCQCWRWGPSSGSTTWWWRYSVGCLMGGCSVDSVSL
eukprot:GFUD01013551.1.p1 GENE.GFUD01013551.1~~GFUD01013551.1.p1  ORF type:complete len:322 (-),score=107.52 GFUD01013551.1:6-971(-)